MNFKDPTGTYPNTFPTKDIVQDKMKTLGFDVNDKIILYEQPMKIGATRGFWVLHAWGFKQVFVLDGGILAWKKAGFETEPGIISKDKPIRIMPSDISLDSSRLVFIDELTEDIRGSKKFVIVDNRPSG